MPAEADAVEAAVNAAVTEGLRTADTAVKGQPVTGCQEAARIIAEKIGQ
ncbi:hypothetical protein LJC60_10960 [Ruminococcaceae bacterium OttesenSCG-928-D13]|nr:hypothetical protein [Ruminococcaceae bacterium OttesenSCG-928-D13]